MIWLFGVLDSFIKEVESLFLEFFNEGGHVGGDCVFVAGFSV